MTPRPGRLLRRLPFTSILLITIFAIAIGTGTLVTPIDPALRRIFGFAPIHLPGLEWYRLFTSALLTTGGSALYTSTATLAIAVGAAEWVHGTRRTLAVFWGVHLATLLLSSLVLALPLSSAGVVRGRLLAHASDVGPSAGYFGCLGFAVGARWPRARAALVSVLVAFFLARLAWSFLRVPDHGRQISADLAHALAFPLGLLIAARWPRPASARGAVRAAGKRPPRSR